MGTSAARCRVPAPTASIAANSQVVQCGPPSHPGQGGDLGPHPPGPPGPTHLDPRSTQLTTVEVRPGSIPEPGAPGSGQAEGGPWRGLGGRCPYLISFLPESAIRVAVMRLQKQGPPERPGLSLRREHMSLCTPSAGLSQGGFPGRAPPPPPRMLAAGGAGDMRGSGPPSACGPGSSDAQTE